MLAMIAGWINAILLWIKSGWIWLVEKFFNLIAAVIQSLIDIYSAVINFLVGLLPATPPNILLGLHPPDWLIDLAGFLNFFLPIDAFAYSIAIIMLAYVHKIAAAPIIKFAFIGR